MANTLTRISDKLHVFRVLRYRDFRFYWFGHLTAVAGHQMVILAHGWLAWELTRSEYVLGALGLVAATPAVALTLFGGAAADKLELRRFLMVLQYVTALLLFVLATLVTTGLVQVWHLFAVAAIHGGIQAFDHPARQALFPNLLERSHLMNAVSLNSMIWPGTRIFGPALAGFIIGYMAGYTGAPLSGVGAAYYVAAATYLTFGLLAASGSCAGHRTHPGRPFHPHHSGGAFVRVDPRVVPLPHRIELPGHLLSGVPHGSPAGLRRCRVPRRRLDPGLPLHGQRHWQPCWARW